MEKKKEKLIVLCEVKCPHCDKALVVLKQVKIIRPAEKAEREEKFFAQKIDYSQTTLT